jgi:hypothetical protein
MTSWYGSLRQCVMTSGGGETPNSFIYASAKSSGNWGDPGFRQVMERYGCVHPTFGRYARWHAADSEGLEESYLDVFPKNT